ncbi:hypothetical protein H4V97_002628 [Flavobacterium sp. CG_23.5]|uniref:LamG-like jellyroll fold domain-containing protein n=1 Tax=Flavobacterium sp. CG_23.5 TaxID=2760708 RepID=UPI001AEA0D0C|nr:LamG-like jellyroll fold domain-containing protein [Flavobacterium sp. CG_23.5]MBP2284310.1 hypothetical protein [Flavobacterium sp. CG_23.5]
MKQIYLLSNTVLPKQYLQSDTKTSKYNNSLNTKILYNLCRSILALFLFLSANYSQAQTKIIYKYTGTSGSWTCPVGVTSITVEAWGAGAGGSLGGATKGLTGGGGGGGAYARLSTVTVVPGTPYNFTVGGASTTFYATAGTSTSGNFGGRDILAVGGNVGEGGKTVSTGGKGGLASACFGDIKFSGGDGGTSKGDSNSSGSGAGGGGGGGAGSLGNGATGGSPSGTTFGGAGGVATSVNGGAGGNGGNDRGAGQRASTSGYGGGGGGSGDNNGQGWQTTAGLGQDGALIITLNLPYGPGGVTKNLQLWLRSDLLDGTTSVADNTAVSTWKTQALGDDAIKPTGVGSPVYRNNLTSNLNFNSVVDFTNAYNSPSQTFLDTDNTRQYLKAATGFYSQDIFVVTIPDVTVTTTTRRMDLFCGSNSTTNDYDDTGIGFGDYTTRFNNEALTYAVGVSPDYGIATATYGNAAAIINTRNNDAIAPTAQELFYNGNNTNPTSYPAAFSNVTNSQYWIGRSKAYTGNLDARVAEVITYDTRATDAERSNIRSYLAIKYGITLGTNGTSMNYTNSAGSTIWNVNTGVPANDIFNYDIAGIGRDDITKLTQKQSRSINNVNGITIGLGDIAATNTANTNVFDTDKKFLVWGNNGGALTAQAVTFNLSSGISPTLSTDVSYQRIAKIWKVVETGGDVSTCKVAIPTTQIAAAYTAAATATGDYVMLISSTPTFDATSEARIMTVNGTNLETTYNFDGTKYITFGYAPETPYVRCIKFDGINDYLDAGNVLNLNSSFTVSAWVKSTKTNMTILSKRNSAFTQGYDLKINTNGKAEMSWNGNTITSYSAINTGKWHHIGVVYDGTNAKIYIDGVNKNSVAASAPTSSNNSFLIAAANGIAPTAFFEGSIDEVRIWNVALTAMQLKYVMNQEIINNAGITNGVIIPNTITLNEIKAIPWSNLTAYYPMSTFSINNVKDKSGYGLTAALKNINTVDLQTAPLPYETSTTGEWSSSTTWVNGDVQDIPNSASVENPSGTGPPPPNGLSDGTVESNSVDGTIIRVKSGHTLTSLGNKKALALLLETGSSLLATATTATQATGSKIEVSHYLKLDGKIDLVGRSQLVQTEGSDLDATSAGSIERDQQGQSNKYNYNYWSSPVGTINNTTNNNPFTVGGVLQDGTNPAVPIAINWVNGYNGSPGNPISLARYWIYKFDNASNNYANWIQILETGSLTAGKGFTLKGSGAATATQNLTFVGKPNNGTITNTVTANQLLLVGNPYPSALDADKFINDNILRIDVTTTIPATDGALYFWEHYASNTTHNLSGYQGGYGIYNISGGVAPSSTGVDFISGAGSTSKAIPPQPYIPVGQGFFVFGNASGGNVVFKNSQRAFVKEDNAFSQTTYRIPVDPKIAGHWTFTGDDPVAKKTHKKIRLGFNSYNEEFHRQVLLAFMEDKADSDMNDGYDAVNIDDAPSDMYLINGENELAIEGEGYFDAAASYPIGVRTESAGKVSFGIDALENFDESQPIFIHDAETDTYHTINKDPYEVTLAAGTFNDRFTLRFTDKTLGTDTFNLAKADEVNVIGNQNVTVQSSNQLIKNIVVYDLLGRKIDSYKKVNALKYSLSHLNKTTAGLIVKITLEDDTVVSKKIIY